MALVVGEFSASCSGHFTPGERDTGNLCVGSWRVPESAWTL